MDLTHLPFYLDIGAGALLALAVWLLLIGKIRPQRAVQELREDAAERVKDSRDLYLQAREMIDKYEQAFNASEDARKRQAEVLDGLLHTVQLFQDTINRIDGGGVRDAVVRQEDGETQAES